MKTEYYPILGRGDDGDKFQLARIKDDKGDVYKGQFDQARHFGSTDELKEYLSGVVNVPAADLVLEKMHL